MTSPGSRCLAWLLVVVLGASPLAAQWAPCDETARATREECAVIPVPLDHGVPDGPTIRLAVRRIPAAGQERRQLWFVDGGPGDAGTAALAKIGPIFAADSDLAIYTFDHRGTGSSVPLTCPAQQRPASPDGAALTEAEWPACITYLRTTRPDLPFITVGQAARDLGLLVDRFRVPGAAVTVWGVSYGTFLVWEYLRAAVRPPDAVIADGIVPADWSFAEFDAGLDAAGRRWLAECSGEADCAAHLGADPVSFVRGAARSLELAPCRELGLTPAMYRLILGNLLMAGDPLRRLIPVVAYRVHRCNGWDRRALSSLVANLFESGRLGEQPSHNPVAQRHIAMSSLWHERDPGAEQLRRGLNDVVMTTAVSASFARTFPDWPRAAGPGSTSQPGYRGPMLLLHGDHDPTMPVERLAGVRDRYRGDGQRFLVVPWAGHVTLNESPCVRSIYLGFLSRPDAVPDTGCFRELTRRPMVPDAKLAESALGTGDVWGARWPGWLFTALMTGLYLGVPAILLLGAGLLWRRTRPRRDRRGRAAYSSAARGNLDSTGGD